MTGVQTCALPICKGRPRVNTLDCTYIAFDFEDTTKRDQFEKGILEVLTRRLEQCKEFASSRRRAEREAERPVRLTSVESSSLGRVSSFGISSAPKLPEVRPMTPLMDSDGDMETGSEKVGFG